MPDVLQNATSERQQCRRLPLGFHFDYFDEIARLEDRLFLEMGVGFVRFGLRPNIAISRSAE
jgi:hypothetical protein